MKIHAVFLIHILLSAASPWSGEGQPKLALPGQPPVLLELEELDLHLHAGMERPLGLTKWIDLAVADGRKVILVRELLALRAKRSFLRPGPKEAGKDESRAE